MKRLGLLFVLFSACWLGLCAPQRATASLVLVPTMSQWWLYLDDGSDQGTAWREPDFDDLTWAFGSAEFGYGVLGNLVPYTEVSFGGDPDNKFVTTYFRHEFYVDETDLASFSYYTLELLRDDGAAVYVNGVEIRRDNLPEDVDTAFDTLATGTVSGDDESTFFVTNIRPDLPPVQAGWNVLAVELHQTTLTSSDLGMDLEFIGQTGLVPAGEVTMGVITGLEEADVDVTAFERTAPEHVELEWETAGTAAATGSAGVVDTFTDPDDPNNLHQFHLNNGSLVITSEPIDVRDWVAVQVSVDVRAWQMTLGFEGSDDVDLSVLVSRDGFEYDEEIFWLETEGEGNFGEGSLEVTGMVGEENGPFTTFLSPSGLIPDDVISLQVVVDIDNNSNNEHFVWDNVWVTGIPIGDLSSLDWEGPEDAEWDSDVAWSGDPGVIPDEFTQVTIPTNTVTVAGPGSAYSVSLDGPDAALVVAEESTLAVTTGVAVNETSLDVQGTMFAGPLSVVSGSLNVAATGQLTASVEVTAADSALTVLGSLDTRSLLLDAGSLEVGPEASLNASHAVEATGSTLDIQGELHTASVNLDTVEANVQGTLDVMGTVELNATTLNVVGTLNSNRLDVTESSVDVVGTITTGPVDVDSGSLNVVLEATFESADSVTLSDTVAFNLGGTFSALSLTAPAGLTLGPHSRLNVENAADLGPVAAVEGAAISGDITVGGTLDVAEGPATLPIEGALTMAAGSEYIVDVGQEGPDLLAITGDATLEPGSTLTFRIDGGDRFRAGTHKLITLEGGTNLDGVFSSSSGLGGYVSQYGDGLAYIATTTMGSWLEVEIDYDLNAGDANLDTVTDVRDFNVWNANKFTGNTEWISGDFNGDGITDVRDFNIWNSAKFTSATAAAVPPAPLTGQAVPEPATLALLALAGLVLLIRTKVVGQLEF